MFIGVRRIMAIVSSIHWGQFDLRQTNRRTQTYLSANTFSLLFVRFHSISIWIVHFLGNLWRSRSKFDLILQIPKRRENYKTKYQNVWYNLPFLKLKNISRYFVSNVFVPNSNDPFIKFRIVTNWKKKIGGHRFDLGPDN